MRGTGPEAIADEAFAASCADHRGLLVGYAILRCRDRNLAEDIAQDALLIAWRRRSDAPMDRLRAWLLTIAGNRCREEARRGQRRGRHTALSEVHAGVVAAAAAHERTDDDRRDALGGYLRTLAPEDRQLLYDRFVDGRGIAGLAVDLGETPERIRARLVRLRAALRSRLRTAFPRRSR